MLARLRAFLFPLPENWIYTGESRWRTLTVSEGLFLQVREEQMVNFLPPGGVRWVDSYDRRLCREEDGKVTRTFSVTPMYY